MNSTTPNNDLIKEVTSLLINAIPNATIGALQFVWNIIKIFIHDNLMYITIVLVVVLIYSILRALMGDWWVLGRVLYKYLYWGSGLLIAFIWGPEVFTGTYVEIWMYILSMISFVIVGIILKNSGLKKFK